MADFSLAYKLTGLIEGGYANNPSDKGGETYEGVARASNPTWQGWGIIDAYKTKPDFPKNLDGDASLQAAVKSFFQANYWDSLKLNMVNEQRIANELYDIAVNMGTTVPMHFLQRALNISNRNEKDYKDILDDGSMGTLTLRMLNNHPRPLQILKIVTTLQGAKYITICEANKTQEIFLTSWIDRAFAHLQL